MKLSYQDRKTLEKAAKVLLKLQGMPVERLQGWADDLVKLGNTAARFESLLNMLAQEEPK